jgi:DNA-binding response OmpR family regulator
VAEQLSILVVDDEYDLADLLAELLAERGHRVTTAINGMLGMALLMSKEFDLVISDFMMPVMDGLEMVKSMRVEPKLAAVPVIMMSAQIETVAAAGNGLVQAVLQKPFRPKALFAMIAEVLESN